MQTKSSEREQARNLFFQSDLPQTEIAAQLGIGERTLSRWVSEGQWRRLKKAAQSMPAQLVDNFQLQLAEMQETIMSRPKGQRFATESEAAIMSKLVLCSSRMKVQVTQSNSIQVIMNYLDLVKSRNPEIIMDATRIANEFLTGKAKDGFYPFDFENDNGLFDEEPEYEMQDNPNSTNDTSILEMPAGLHNTSPSSSSSFWKPGGEATPIPANPSHPLQPNTTNNYSLISPSQPANENINAQPAIDPDTLRIDMLKPGLKNITWLGYGYVVDHLHAVRRKITTAEWNQLLQNGYTLNDLDNYNFQSDPVYDEQMRIAKKNEEQKIAEQRE